MNKNTDRTKRRKSPQPAKEPPAKAPDATRSQSLLNRYFGINTIVILAFIAFCFWIMAVKNGFMLRWYDEMSLFEPTRLFFRQCLYYPGGLLRYAGAWLTQFMYYPFLGSTVIIVLWLLTAWLTRIAFNLDKVLIPLTLLVPIAMLVSIVQLDEAWLSIKTVGYIFSNTLGYLFTIAVFLAFKAVNHNRILSIAVGIMAAILYPIGGFFAILAAILCALQLIAGSLKKDFIRGVGAILILVATWAVPLIYYHYLGGNTVDNDFLYLKGLPEFLMESYDNYLWRPFIVATACISGLWLVSLKSSWKPRRLWSAFSIAAVCGCAIWSIQAEQKSEQLRATVLMLQSIDKGNWQKVIDVMALIKEPPNYSMRVIENQAIVKLGGEKKDMGDSHPVNKDARHAEFFTLTAFIQVPINYHIGRFNQSYRWAMEHSVQYGRRVFFLKYMVKDALMNGDTKLAKKYNDMLLRTMFHRKWAEEMARYIDDPSLIDKNPEFLDVLMSSETQKNQSTTNTLISK